VITLSRGLPAAADQCPPPGGRAFWLEGEPAVRISFPPAESQAKSLARQRLRGGGDPKRPDGDRSDRRARGRYTRHPFAARRSTSVGSIAKKRHLMPVGEEAVPAISWARGSHRLERWRYDIGLRPTGLARTISGEHTRAKESRLSRQQGLGRTLPSFERKPLIPHQI
jgi:hypothetical protein